MSTEIDVLDLDAERQTRAAAREGQAETLPIRFKGEVITTLDAELPLDTLAPLRAIDDDLALLLRTAVQSAQGGDAASRVEATNLVVDMLVANPALPSTVLDVIAAIGRNLLSPDGYDKFLAGRPSKEDVGALAKGVFAFYGLSLGEASASSDSSPDGGGTSNTTSSTTSTSTPGESSPGPETLAS